MRQSQASRSAFKLCIVQKSFDNSESDQADLPINSKTTALACNMIWSSMSKSHPHLRSTEIASVLVAD